MGEGSRFERWVALAAGERAPQPDVTVAVQARIVGQPALAGPTAGFAMTCCAVAALAMLVAWPAVSALNDPWVGWLLGVQAGWLL